MVTSSFLPGRGGIESYLARLCADMAPRLAVLAPGSRDGSPVPSDLPYPSVGYKGSLLVPSRGVLQAIEAVASAHGTRRVLFGTPWPLALLGPRLLARGYRYAVIVHGAETIVPSRVPTIKGRFTRALSGADLLLPVSDFTRAKLERVLPREPRIPPMHLLRAAVDLSRFRPLTDPGPTRKRLGLPDGDRIVLCFGRLVRRKGVHRLISVARDLRQRVPHAAVAVAGTGPEESRLRRMAREMSAPVHFLGRVTDTDAPSVYGMAEVFAFPVADRWAGMDTEGLGVVLLEAAACGVPCVTGRSGGTPEAVHDGTTGFVVDARREADLMHAIATLLEDRALARRMGHAGRQLVASSFSGEPPRAFVDWLGS